MATELLILGREYLLLFLFLEHQPALRHRRLGGEAFADDNFHLRPASPAIDAGSATAAELGITGSAAAGLASDPDIVDLGYHYGADVQ